MIKSAGQKNVRLKGSLFKERSELNRRYLKELDTTCLLQNFYLEAGIIMPGLQIVPDPTKVKLHWGWESPTCQLRGHFLGHWMSAAAHYIASDNDAELKLKLDTIVSELARCQKYNGGEWVGSIPEKYFELLAEDRYIWSPQYTMHKTIMGLVDTFKYADNMQALDIADKLADWYIKWAEHIKAKNPFTVYKGEQGGMLEMWAELYSMTNNDKYKILIDHYKDNGLYSSLEAGKDALTDNHANASIPLFHGAARMYEITGDERWKNITELFWKNAVDDRGMYATTGQNAGEFWIPPFKQGQYIGDSDQEFCTVYNMVRAADYLFKRTGDTKYADYIEKCLYNGFLTQQNGFTGMTAYFLPLRAGSRKKWSSKTNDFWCCCGTMVQAQAIYPKLIWYTDKDRLTISQYIPSETSVEIGGKKISAELSTEMRNYDNQVFFDDSDGSSAKSRWSFKVKIHCADESEFTLSLRVPGWCAEKPLILSDGEKIEADITNGYINISKKWHENEIYIFFPSRIVSEPLADMPETAAFVDGPIVLAGLTAKDCGLRGDFSDPGEFIYQRTEHTYSTFVWRQNCYITRNQRENIEFKPLYDISDEEYTVYFTEIKE